MAGKLSKGQKWLLAITAVFIAIAATVGIVSSVQERALIAKIEKAKAAGFPFESSDIEEGLIDHPGQNAAASYSNVRSKTASIIFTDLQLGRDMVHALAGCSLDQSEWDFLDTHLKEYSPILNDFERGARMDYCYFEKDWNLVFRVEFPELSEAKQVAKHFAARIRLNSRKGDYDAVASDLKTLLILSQHIQAQPHLIQFNVAGSINRIFINAVKSELSTAMEDSSLRQVVREAVELLPEQLDLTKLIEMEAFTALWLIDNYFATGELVLTYISHVGPANTPTDKLVVNALSTGWAIREMKSSAIDLWMEVIQEYEVGDDEIEFFMSLQSRIDNEMTKSKVLDYFYGIVSQSYPPIPGLLKYVRASRRSLLAAFDVMDYRDEYGEWPTTLPVEYTDPFDDQSLRYKVTTDGFRVWSVDSDGIDHGGATYEDGGRFFDLVTVYPPILTRFEAQPRFGGPGAVIAP